jgi:hypothetical protein
MSKSSSQLRPGDVVEVRPWPEIRATLDENGMGEGLAFMPEMLKHCDRRFVVSKRITGTYESALGGASHLQDVVLLHDVRCDGSGHDACRKACVLCWKQTWLKRVDEGGAAPATSPTLDTSAPAFPYQQANGRYRCQYEEPVVVGASVGRSKAPTEVTTHRIRRLAQDEYAALQQAVGAKIFCVEGHWWRQVRPCFYRPLLPYREFTVDTPAIPLSAWLGGSQHVVPCGQQANSTMSFLMFTDGGDYSLDSLRKKPRQQVRWAEKKLVVHDLADRAEFKRQAFPVYKEFYARTQYYYLGERSKRENFDRWADAIYDYKSSLILGAYRGPQLCAVSIAQAVEDTLIYSTIFATDQALRDHVSSFLLHAVRVRASQDGGIAQVYAGMPKTAEARGIDDFLRRRGCRVVTKPAALWLNPASKLVLGWLFSGQYARIRGEPTAPASMDAETAEDSTTDSYEQVNGRGTGS